jgi:DNA-binding GntR family transcriptional regulator
MTAGRAIVRARRQLGPKFELRAESGASVADRIHADLKKAIVSGELKPGTPIDKNEIRIRFRASLSPVTIAVNRLGYEQLVVIEPQRGSFVAPIVRDDILQLMSLRQALEGDAVAEATRRRSNVLSAALERNLIYQQASVKSSDITGFYELDVELHRLIIDASGLRKFNEVLDDVRPHLDRVRLLMLPSPGRMEGTLAEHQAIIEGIVSGNVRRAEAAMRNHLRRVREEFHAYSAAHPEMFFEPGKKANKDKLISSDG